MDRWMGIAAVSTDLGTAPSESPTAEPAGAGWLRWAWRQLTSMRVALVLLFVLALAAIPGSVLPQRSNDPIKVNEWLAAHPRLGPVIDSLGGFQAYASPWFASIYLLLCVSVIGCVLPRTMLHVKALRTPPPSAPRRLTRMPSGSSWITDSDPDEVLATARLSLRGWRIRTSSTGADAKAGESVPLGTDRPDGDGGGIPPVWISAERGYMRETGNLLFHASLILLLIAVAFGSLFGWKGQVIVREKAGFSNTVTQFDTFSAGALTDPDTLPPFAFTLDDFQVTFEREGSQRGAPRSFEAHVTYTSAPGATPERRVVKVNDPLRVDGSSLYLVGHGYAPHIIVKDSTGTVVFDDTVVFLPQDGNFTSTGVVKSPDSTPQMGFQALFLPTATVDQTRGPISLFPEADEPRLFMSAFEGDLGLDSGTPQSVFRLDSSRMSQIGLQALAPGQTWTLPKGKGSVTFVGFDRWASFSVAHNPGQLWALLAAVIGIVGLSLSLFVRRRRVWVRATPDGAGLCLVEIAGLDRAEGGHVADDVKRLSRDVLTACPASTPVSGAWQIDDLDQNQEERP